MSQFLQAASFLARRLVDSPLPWVMSEPPAGLYSGPLGVAFFLAAHAMVTGSSASRARCFEVLGLVRPLLRGRIRRGQASTGEPLGGLTGLGSWIYGLVCLAELLKDEELGCEASEFSALLTEEVIVRDEALGVVDGSAGILLALLALDRISPQSVGRRVAPLDLAQACGHHLVSRQISSGPWAGAWPPPTGLLPLAGFAHGASGICLALGRLMDRTGDQALREAIRWGLAFEERLWSAEHGNWRDQQEPLRLPLTRWCYGAPGIAVARLGLLETVFADAVEGDGLRRDLTRALDATCRKSQTPVDHLCCGNMGRVEVLAYAGRALAESSWRAEAERLAVCVLRAAKARGDFGFDPDSDKSAGASLFRGAAGIGFAYLRLATDQPLPRLLLLD